MKNSENKIDVVLSRVGCEKHDCRKDQPCYWIQKFTSKHMVFGVCNWRARQAGFLGKIDPKSLQMNRKPSAARG